jgi:hypothetical protein
MNRKQSIPSLSSDFKHFIRYHAELSFEDQEYVLNLFSQPHIKKTVRVGIILVIWTIIYSSVDGILLGIAIVQSTVSSFSLLQYVPWILFSILNFIVKSFFLNWYDSKKTFTRKQKLLGAIPSVGVIFFLGAVLKEEKLFRSSVRSYLRYVRRRGVRYMLTMLNRRAIQRDE